MPSITELKLNTALNLNSFTQRKWLAQHINKDNFICHSYYQMKSTRVKSNSKSFILNKMGNFKFSFIDIVVPDFNWLVCWTGDN